MESISFTVPLDPVPLERTAEMLGALAGDIREQLANRDHPELPLSAAADLHPVHPQGMTLGADAPVPPDPPALPEDPQTPEQLFGAGSPGAEAVEQLTPPAGVVVEHPAAAALNPDAVAPSGALSVPPPPPPAVDVDSTGLPWDNRIHTATKTRLKGDDTWRKKRNVEPAERERIEAELRAGMAAVAPTAEVVAHDAAVVGAMDAVFPLAETGAAAPPPPPPPPPPAAVAAPTTFPEFMPIVSKAMHDKTLTPERLAEVLSKYGIPQTPLVANRPELIPQIYAELFPVPA